MAINIRCGKCQSDLTVGTKKCKKCKTVVPKNRKYRVIVRQSGRRIIKTVSSLELARDVELH
jgi:hypothetical protein